MLMSRRLDAYLRLFAARDDVHVWAHRRAAPSASAALPEDAAWLNDASILFAWSPDEPDGDEEKPSFGGVLHLDPGHDEGWVSAEARYFDDVSTSLIFDATVEEGLGVFLVAEDGGPAFPAFYNANDESVRRFESLEAYLTLGARRGFVLYWADDESGEWEELVEPLLDASLPDDTDSEALRAALEARGASPEEAEALVEWLGADARILAPLE